MLNLILRKISLNFSKGQQRENSQNKQTNKHSEWLLDDGALLSKCYLYLFIFFPAAFPNILLLQSTEKFCLICLSYVFNYMHIFRNVLKIKYTLKFVNKVPPESTKYIGDLE